MEEKKTIEVRELYGADARRFWELKTPAFHFAQPYLAEANANEILEAKDNDRRAEVIGEKNAQFLRLCALLNGKIVAGLECKNMMAWFDGHICPMGGIGAVLSDPEVRRTGANRALYGELFRRMRAQGQYISHLYGFHSVFYRKFGYEVSAQHIRWRIPADFLPDASNAGIVRYVGTAEQQKAIRTVIDSCRSKYNFAVYFTDTAWEEYLVTIDPYSSKRYSYLHYDADGTADGFLSYEIVPHEDRPQTFDATHGFWYTTIPGARALLAYMATYGSYTEDWVVCTAESTDITRLLQEMNGGWGQKNTERTVHMDGTSRVVDVAEVLKLARYRGSGSVLIRVTDPFCDWNDHTFRVDYAPDRVAVTVSDGDSPDLEANIGDFSSLLFGRYSMENVEYLPDVKVNGNVEGLSGIFYRKPLWIEEHF